MHGQAPTVQNRGTVHGAQALDGFAVPHLWALLAFATLSPRTVRHSSVFDLAAIVGTAGFAFIIVFWCRSGEPLSGKRVRLIVAARVRRLARYLLAVMTP